MSLGQEIVSIVHGLLDQKRFREQHWEGSFEDFLQIVSQDPKVARSAFQRVYDMIVSHGATEYRESKLPYLKYHFFEDRPFDGVDAIYGLDGALMHMVNVFKAAAQNYGTERRVLLLHGPVGSANSTVVQLLKKGLEEYSKTSEGGLYSFRWVGLAGALPEHGQSGAEKDCPMHEDPLHLIPIESRSAVLEKLNAGKKEEERISIGGELCPACRQIYRELLRKYDGEWMKIIDHIRVRRFILSEKDRVGIGTLQPKDEKNQDSTEVTGDINYRRIAEYGSDSDPRAFNFDGEFNIANRGLIEFIEVLKLDVAFLYDLLGASQEHKIKPKKFAHTDIDEVIIGHTNEPEYRKLQNNEFMEALRDRTVKIDIPYITKLNEEIKIYLKDYNPARIKGKHIAPHPIEVAAMWAVLTRLEEPKKADLTALQKLKLYNGKSLPGFTEDNVKELRKEARREGMEGISPRYIQDKISNALVSDRGEGCINPFMVINELESGLKHNSLITSEEARKRFRELLTTVKQEYE